MIKQKIKHLCLIVTLAGLVVHTAKGQQYVKDFLTHKVVVNEVDRSIVAHVKPVKNISADFDKRYYWFSINQINSTQGGFSGKLLNGTYQEFYVSKQPKELGYMNKGLKDGVWKRWDEHGMLVDDYKWSSGKMNGIYHKYDSVGKIQETGKYKNDLLQGKQLIYTNNGLKEVFYKNGKVAERKKIKMPKFISKIFQKKPKTM